METLKKYWWAYTTALVLCGGLVAFGADITKYKKLPEQVAITSESVEKVTNSLDSYIAVQTERDVRQDQMMAQQTSLFEILAANLVEITKDG